MTLWYSRRRTTTPISGAPALRIDHLRVAHPHAARLAIDDLSLSVEPGTRVALIGPNGAGKSTLIKAIAGLLSSEPGSISIHGLPIGACHHRVAYLPQRGEIDWRFPVTVRRLVLGGRYVHLGWLRTPGAQDRAIADDMLDRLGISDLAERQIGELSGGQQQRALLARALAQQADLLLLDEPFNAVDSETRDVIARIMDEQRHEGRTLLVATHDLERIAGEFDRVVTLRDGRIVADLPAAEFEAASQRTPPHIQVA